MATRIRKPYVPITEIEHSAFCKPEDELPAKSLAEEMAVNVRWQKISSEYLHYSPQELDRRINAARKKTRYDRHYIRSPLPTRRNHQICRFSG